MALSPTTASELTRIVASVNVLLTLPDVKIRKIPADSTICSICHDPFAKDPWKMGETVNSPVKVECGHIFGIQCLARLLYSDESSARCPLCRAKIVPKTVEENPSVLAWDLVTPVLRLLLGLGQDLAPVVKAQTLEILQTTLRSRDLKESVSIDRIMIIYEELYTQFCRPSAAAQRAVEVQAANDNHIYGLEEELRLLQELCDNQSKLIEGYRELSCVDDAFSGQHTKSLCRHQKEGRAQKKFIRRGMKLVHTLTERRQMLDSALNHAVSAGIFKVAIWLALLMAAALYDHLRDGFQGRHGLLQQTITQAPMLGFGLAGYLITRVALGRIGKDGKDSSIAEFAREFVSVLFF